MDGLSRSLARVIFALTGGALAGVIAWLVANAVSPYTYALATPLAPTAAVGLAAGLGSELGLRTRQTWAPGHLLAWGLALLAAVFLYGGAVVALVRLWVWQIEGATAVILILVPSFAFAFAAGVVAGRRGWPVAWVDGLGALAMFVAGALAFALGAGLFAALTYTNPCLRLPPYAKTAYGYLDLGRWGMLQLLLVSALVVGACLGGALWLALSLGGALRARRV